MIGAQQRELGPKQQKIELLRVEVVVGKPRRQPGDLIYQFRFIRVAEALPGRFIRIVLDEEPLRPHDEIVQAHRRNLFMETSCRVSTHGLQLLVLPCPLVDLADELDPLHEEPLRERIRPRRPRRFAGSD